MGTEAFTARQRRLAKLLGIRLSKPKRIRRYRCPIPDTFAMLNPLGSPPEQLPEEWKQIWQDVLAYAPPGILAKSDRAIVEISCHCLSNLKASDPLVAEMELLSSCLSRMLFAPDRRRELVMRYLPLTWIDDVAAVMGGLAKPSLQ